MWKWEDVEMGRCGNGEMGRWEDVEMGRWGNGKMWKWGIFSNSQIF